MRLRSGAFIALVTAAGAVVFAACKSQPTHNTVSADCKTTFDYDANPNTGWSSPAAGALTLTGSFYPDETVELEYIDNTGTTRVFTGTVPTARSTLTMTGLPSGTTHYVVAVSCADGKDESHANGTFTVK